MPRSATSVRRRHTARALEHDGEVVEEHGGVRMRDDALFEQLRSPRGRIAEQRRGERHVVDTRRRSASCSPNSGARRRQRRVGGCEIAGEQTDDAERRLHARIGRAAAPDRFVERRRALRHSASSCSSAYARL